MSTSCGGVSQNIILNHDFSQGRSEWIANDCDFKVVNDHTGSYYAETTGRDNFWSCLEQDIKNRVVEGRRYKASARVRIRGSPSDRVNAKVKLIKGVSEEYLPIKGFKTTISEGEWCTLEGKFTMGSTDIDEILFYIFGPKPGVDLHITSVELTCLDAHKNEAPSTTNGAAESTGNIQIPSKSAGAATNPLSESTKNNEITKISGDDIGNKKAGTTEGNQMGNNNVTCFTFFVNLRPAGQAGEAGAGALDCSAILRFLRTFLRCFGF